ncbi:1-acyl-sn-glycerol-3-phosphate acyltransferase [Porticoccus sp. W117]|uniref:1-acyl-sn-glycerol-3-phosphate acyltransferase n=1 Tax=Porticoccus sp. W117 TaxID=3054777 RepID=UPI002597CDB0|nr:1-acyl-sn-glycerol-3-phosphate acyltransferase [Porticoccus sp. W117]MDM3869874.1 1-acyl-sn-glycerol-3-phosphate acyltransferase [Porticoccus sp. W117]
MSADFEDIRPYKDSEVPRVLARLVADPELHDTIARMKYPRLARWLPWVFRGPIKARLEEAFAGASDVASFQQVIGHYWWGLMEKQTRDITVSGLEKLNPKASYLFICNHRDIAVDPAVVGLCLDRGGFGTPRIAIGDNLLTKPFTSDLMRLNKSFIVKRSVSGRREKLAALLQLSGYIRHSICQENSSIWIAQREGRAKDGLDRTDTALIKMLSLSKGKEQEFAEAMGQLNIVPVTLSYELDPCDGYKARELYEVEKHGSYQKSEHEDLKSIYKGIVGEKGLVHVAFGEPLTADELESADTIAAAIDQHVIENYHQHSSNLIAYNVLHGDHPNLSTMREKLALSDQEWAEREQQFKQRMQELPAEHRNIALAGYANSVVSQIGLQGQESHPREGGDP